MSQMLPENDMSFAPLGAEQNIEAFSQQQQFLGIIDEAIQQVKKPAGNVLDFPSIYDDKLRQLIDAVPVE